MNLSRQHPSKPVTPSDKVMSVRHKQHRAEVEAMPDSPKKKAMSRYYNLSHAREHLDAEGSKTGKKLVKAIEKIQKKNGLYSLSSFAKR